MSVLDHILAVLAEMDRRYQQRFDQADVALRKAENATETRFNSVNEFRAELGDRSRTFLSRAEYITAHQALVDKISDMAGRLDRMEGNRTGGRDLWGYLVGAAGIAAAVIALIIK